MDATSSLTCGPPIVRFVIKNLKILDMDVPAYIVCVERSISRILSYLITNLTIGGPHVNDDVALSLIHI